MRHVHQHVVGFATSLVTLLAIQHDNTSGNYQGNVPGNERGNYPGMDQTNMHVQICVHDFSQLIRVTSYSIG